MNQPPATPPREIHFLLLPEFSVMGFVSALEPLRVANRFRGDLYRWHILSTDGGPVVASNGMSLNAEAAYTQIACAETLFVVAGFNPLDYYTPAIGAWLRQLDRKGATLGAIDTGCLLLAEAGLLQHQRLTLHWEAISAFAERYPSLSVTQELFEIDHKRITSAGGTASIDMMLDIIGARMAANWRRRCRNNSCSAASAINRTTSACRSRYATACTTRKPSRSSA